MSLVESFGFSCICMKLSVEFGRTGSWLTCSFCRLNVVWGHDVVVDLVVLGWWLAC